MIGLAVQLRSSTARPAAAPSAAVLALAAQGKAPASWNRYAASLLRWEEYEKTKAQKRPRDESRDA
jgi:hypothetical protein